MIPLVAAIVLAGAAGAGPVLVSDACGGDTTENLDAKCAVAEVERSMKSRPRPKELKVLSEGKLYSVPEGVEIIAPPAPPFFAGLWRDFCMRVMCLVDRNARAKKAESECSGDRERSSSSCSCSSREKACDANSIGEHSCQICFEHEHSTVMLPCGHGGVCWDCGVQMYALTGECPMCRNKIDLLVRLDSFIPRREEDGEEYAAVACAQDA